MTRCIIVKLWKTKRTKNIFLRKRERNSTLPMEEKYLNDSKFLTRNNGGQKELHFSFQVLRKRTIQSRIKYPMKIYFRNEEQIKIF